MYGRVFPYQAKGECPLVETPVPSANEWYVPPPEPVRMPIAPIAVLVVACTQLFYPLPAPAVDGWVGPSLAWQRIRKIESVGDGQPLLVPRTAIESWYSTPADPVRLPRLSSAFYPQGSTGPPLVIAPDVLPDLYYSPPPGPIPPPRLPIAFYPQGPEGPPAVIWPDSEQVDQWRTPPPDPIPARRATPFLYQSTTYEVVALLPPTPIDRWQVLQPDPTAPPRMPIALYPPGPPEPVVALTLEIAVDSWYALPSEPIWPQRALPFLYQSGNYEIGATLPIAGFVSASPILGIFAARRAADRVVLGTYVTPRTQ